MLNLPPTARLILVIILVSCNAVLTTVDGLDVTLQAVLVAVATAIAGLGVIPPQATGARITGTGGRGGVGGPGGAGGSGSAG